MPPASRGRRAHAHDRTPPACIPPRAGSASRRPARAWLLLAVPHRFFFLTGVVQIAVDCALVGLGARRSRLAGRSRARGRGSGDVAARAADAVRVRAVLHVRLPVHGGPALAGRGTAAAVRVAAARRAGRARRAGARPARSGRARRTAPFALRLAAGAYAIALARGSRFVFFRLIRASDAEDKLHAILVLARALRRRERGGGVRAVRPGRARVGQRAPACGLSCCPCS